MPIPFAEVAELARLTRQTALGYIDTDNSGTNRSDSNTLSSSSSSRSGAGKLKGSNVTGLSAAASVRLGLSASESVVFTEGDWIVVLAEEF